MTDALGFHDTQEAGAADDAQGELGAVQDVEEVEGGVEVGLEVRGWSRVIVGVSRVPGPDAEGHADEGSLGDERGGEVFDGGNSCCGLGIGLVRWRVSFLRVWASLEGVFVP